MPVLKELRCCIELSGDQEPLQELGTVYGDAFVETFIPVPKKQQTFTIHLSSRNFIAPGIAMYVFIDGVYQCNRNRQDIEPRRPPDRRSLVDFKVRQKEERQKDGSMIAREWTFEKLDHASADDAADSCSPNVLENIGCIEVVVLRCAGTRNAANMNMDGAADYPDHRLDRASRFQTIAYDGRDLPFDTTNSRHDPLRPETRYRSPYAETVRSREHSWRGQSRYSDPISPGTRPHLDIPAPAYQYGSGPLPPRSEVGNEPLLDRISRAAPTVDPNALERIVADAVKRGVEESRKSDKTDRRRRADSHRGEGDEERSSQVPGAWPASPTHSLRRSFLESAHSAHRDRNYGVDGRRSSRSKAETRVAWDESPEWDEQSPANDLGSPDEKDDSWDTDETWSQKRPKGWEEARHRSRSRSRTVREPSRRPSHATDCFSERHRSTHARNQKARSRLPSHSRDDLRSSLEDNEGGFSYSSTSIEQSDSTLKPAHSRSQIRSIKNRHSRHSFGKERTSREKRLSQLFENPQWHPASVHHAPPSVLVTNAPTIVSAPRPHYSADVRAGRSSVYTVPSVYTQPAMSMAAPPPTWGCASEKPRKSSAATTYLPPAPFGTVSEDRGQGGQSSDSSWGVEKSKESRSRSKKKSSLQNCSWGVDKQGDQGSGTWGGADVKQKNDEWDSTAKGNDGWGGSGDDTANSNNNWGETNTNKATVSGWDTDTGAAGWGQDDAFNAEPNNPWGIQIGNTWGAAGDRDTAWREPQATTNDAPSKAQAGTIWTTAAAKPDITSTAAEQPTPLFPPKRHTSKSLSKYRNFPLPPPHRQFPPLSQSSNKPAKPNRPDPTLPASPLHKIPPSLARKHRIEHQVLAGPGTVYGHAENRPEYVDSLEAPYAVFRFKYRRGGVLRGLGLGDVGRWVREHSGGWEKKR